MKYNSEKMLPYWDPRADYSGVEFYIREVNAKGRIRSSEIPSASLPMTGFLYLSGGEALVEINGQSYLCAPGHLLLIPENTPFAFLYFEDSVGYSGGFKSILHEPIQQAFWFDEATFVSELFRQMHAAFQRGHAGFISKALELLQTLLKIPSGPCMTPLVSHFLDSVFHADGTPATVAEIADELGVSPNYLNRMVKSKTGRSPGKWIDLSRINRAKRLLRDTDQPVIDIAVAVGLDDQSYFTRFFKRMTGMTPSAFRKHSRAMHG